MGEKDYKEKIKKYLSLVIEIGILLYMFFMFFDKGTGLRNLGIYSALFAWAILVIFYKKNNISFDIVTIAFLTLIASILLSSIFSIKPAISFSYFEKDIIKPIAVCIIIGTFFNEEKLIHLAKFFGISGLIILILGLIGFISNPEKIYTSNNILLSVNRNEYAFFISVYIPFFIILLIRSNNLYENLFWGFLLVWGLIAELLTGSRTSTIGTFFSLIAFFVFLLRDKNYLNITKKIAFMLMIVFLISGIIIFSSTSKLDSIKSHWLATSKEIKTFNLRTTCFWKPAIDSIKEKPLLGWGYGGKIARESEPFEKTTGICSQYKGGFHNTYISILFHQGFLGILTFLFLLISTLLILYKTIQTKNKDRKILAIGLFSIIIGCFVVTSMALSIPINRIAPFIGISLAVYKDNEDSNN
jgi:O-antigen ligase